MTQKEMNEEDGDGQWNESKTRKRKKQQSGPNNKQQGTEKGGAGGKPIPGWRDATQEQQASRNQGSQGVQKPQQQETAGRNQGQQEAPEKQQQENVVSDRKAESVQRAEQQKKMVEEMFRDQEMPESEWKGRMEFTRSRQAPQKEWTSKQPQQPPSNQLPKPQQEAVNRVDRVVKSMLVENQPMHSVPPKEASTMSFADVAKKSIRPTSTDLYQPAAPMVQGMGMGARVFRSNGEVSTEGGAGLPTRTAGAAQTVSLVAQSVPTVVDVDGQVGVLQSKTSQSPEAQQVPALPVDEANVERLKPESVMQDEDSGGEKPVESFKQPVSDQIPSEESVRVQSPKGGEPTSTKQDDPNQSIEQSQQQVQPAESHHDGPSASSADLQLMQSPGFPVPQYTQPTTVAQGQLFPHPGWQIVAGAQPSQMYYCAQPTMVTAPQAAGTPYSPYFYTTTGVPYYPHWTTQQQGGGYNSLMRHGNTPAAPPGMADTPPGYPAQRQAAMMMTGGGGAYRQSQAFQQFPPPQSYSGVVNYSGGGGGMGMEPAIKTVVNTPSYQNLGGYMSGGSQPMYTSSSGQMPTGAYLSQQQFYQSSQYGGGGGFPNQQTTQGNQDWR